MLKTKKFKSIDCGSRNLVVLNLPIEDRRLDKPNRELQF
ncbi:hypothetical protein CKA32_004174 [Geitlerinema sp. FC II]|nr:hypothetical protein CKA32_004174 [Geitlerinema sp. FC II]